MPTGPNHLSIHIPTGLNDLSRHMPTALIDLLRHMPTGLNDLFLHMPTGLDDLCTNENKTIRNSEFLYEASFEDRIWLFRAYEDRIVHKSSG